MFHDDERVFNNATRLSSTGKRMKRYPMGHEWHRGIASHVTIPLDTSSLASSSPAYSLPFELRIPTSMTITESSQYVNARGIKTPPRGSCDVPRSPPPTLRNHRNASVEWVVEAIVRFDSASAPEYSRTGEATVARADERGFLNSRPPDFLVARSVFPFVPRDRDLAPLYDFGDGTAAIPGFAPDPTKRTEAQGAMLVHDGRPAPPRSAKAVEAGAIERPSVVWSKTVQLQGTLGMSGGSIVVRTSIPNGARFERDQARLNMQLRCVFAVKKGLSFKLGGGKGKGKAEEKLQRISVVIMRRVYTRGGAEEEGHVKFEEVRRCEHVFPSTSQDLSVSKREEQADGQDVTVYDLSVDMQSSTARTPTSFQVPSVQLVPSFRLPNIELDVRLPSVTSHRRPTHSLDAVHRHDQRRPGRRRVLLRREVPAPAADRPQHPFGRRVGAAAGL